VKALLKHPEARWLAGLLAFTTLATSLYLAFATGPIRQAFGSEPDWFAPSLMWAAGRGLITPVPESVPGLTEFLREQSKSFDIDTIPDNVATWDLSPFCQTHRYLLYAVGVVWWLFGVSWETIKLVPLLAHMVATAALYGLFRLGCGRRVAVLGAAFVMLSPPVLAMLPSVRDFCKMPFFMLIFLVLGLLVRGAHSPSRHLGLAAGLGALCGVGIGFRQDFMACIPPCLVAVALLSPTLSTWKHRVAAVGLLLATFFITGWPVLGAIQRENGAVSSHSLAQGLSTEAESRLNFGGASYELIESSNDNLVHAAVYNFDRRAGHHEPMQNYLSPVYGDAGRRFFRAVALTFPYDLSMRAFAAVRACFKILPNAPPEFAYTAHFENGAIKAWAALFAWPAWLVSLAALPCAAAVVLVLLGIRPRWGLGMVLLALYFTGYTSVLFQYRHAFHLAFIAPFLVCVALSGLLSQGWKAEAFSLRRGAAWSAGLVVAAVGALMLLSLVQSARVAPLIQQHQSAKLELIPTTRTTEKETATLTLSSSITPPVSADAGQMEAPSAYVALRFDALPPGGSFDIVYDTPNPGNDFSRTVRVPSHFARYTGPATCYFPVYEAATAKVPEVGFKAATTHPVVYERARFSGVRLPSASSATLHQVANADAFPFFHTLWLTPDEDTMRLHKRWIIAP
jgi:hypothetical protein